MTDLIGKTIGKYEVIARLGSGGMAAVYKAYQANLDRHIALKVLNPSLVDNEDFIVRFRREAAAIAKLRHTNIVQVHDFDVQDNLYYMVMEYIDGPTLKEELYHRSKSNAPFSLREISAIFDDLASAVDYAHQRGMIHRDLKPANVMLSNEGHAVLTDFGIARLLNATQMTMTGAIFGTPAYMSPEQGQGERGDERSDIYALGVMLYEMVTGRVPFDADTPVAVIMKHISEPLPAPTQANSNIPNAVEQVILKSLSKSPADRYQSAGNMAKALRLAIASGNGDQGAVAASPVSVTRALDQTMPAIEPTPSSGMTSGTFIQPPDGWAASEPAAHQAVSPARLAEPKPEASGRMGWLSIVITGVLLLLLCAAVYAFAIVNVFGTDDDSTTASNVPITGDTDATSVAAVDVPTNTAPIQTATSTLTPVPQATPTTTQTPTPTVTPVLLENCQIKPDNTFINLWDTQRDALGCPTEQKVIIPLMAEELFEGGHLFWRSDTDQVYIVLDRQKNGVERFDGAWELVPPDRKWDNSNPDGVGMSPPAGMVEPKRGFGWLWRNFLGGPDGALGWALDREYGFENLGQVQAYERGLIFKGSDPKIYVLLEDGTFVARR